MKKITVIGNRHILDSFRRAMETNTLAGAYLLEGPPGSGKRTVALFLIALLNCQNAKEGIPCFQCRDCLNVFFGSHPDVGILTLEEGKTTISVGATRMANAALVNAPIHSKRRILLVPDAERLRPEAQNALLKSMEEPGGETLYLLLASEASLLLPTVQSRLIKLRMELFSEAKIKEELELRFPDSDSEAREAAAKLCGGALGSAERFLQNNHLPELRSRIHHYLNLVAEKASFAALCEVLSPDQKKEDIALVYAMLLAALRDAICIKEGAGEKLEFFSDRTAAAKASEIPGQKLIELYEFLCKLSDPSMQNANAAASLFTLSSLAAKGAFDT